MPPHPSDTRLHEGDPSFSRDPDPHYPAKSDTSRPLSWGLFVNNNFCFFTGNLPRDVFVPFLGDFLSIKLNYKKLHALYAGVFVPSLGDFWSICLLSTQTIMISSFRPLSWGLFFNCLLLPVHALHGGHRVFVPFLGDLFSIACLRSPSPSALASAFAAGMGGSLHQALSFGDEMPISPVRTDIGGDLQ